MPKKHRNMIQHTSLFPPEMYEEIKQIAKLNNVTITEAIRLLVEWGLESVK